MQYVIVRYLASLTVLSIAGATGCSGNAASETAPFPRDATPLATAQAVGTTQSATIRQLTDDDRAEIRAIAGSDARLQALVSSTAGDLSEAIGSGEIVLWHTGETLIGGVLTVQLPGPSRIGGEWVTAVAEDDDWSEPLTVVRYRATYEGVTGIDVFVDLRQRAVVRLDAVPRGSTTTVEGPEYLDPIPDVPRRRD